MKVLIIGGAGHVGSLITPVLKAQHTLRIFDMKPPVDTSLEYQEGNLTNLEALRQAVVGMDRLIYMAMGNIQWATDEGIQSAFDVNVKGLYLALMTAHQAGIPHAVYCSTMSVYDGGLETRYFFDEEMTPDARGLYGFTKRMGEEVCRNAWYNYGMSVNALRLCYPVDQAKWWDMTSNGQPTLATTGEDVGRVLLAALGYQNGFQAFMVSGDYENKMLNMGKAKRLLGWEPLARPRP